MYGIEIGLFPIQRPTKSQQLRRSDAFIIKNLTLVFAAMRLTYNKNQNFKISLIIPPKYLPGYHLRP